MALRNTMNNLDSVKEKNWIQIQLKEKSRSFHQIYMSYFLYSFLVANSNSSF